MHLVHHESSAKMHAATAAPLLPFARSRFLSLHRDDSDRDGFQRSVYDHCILQYRRQFNWIAFIDLDEFITVLEQ